MCMCVTSFEWTSTVRKAIAQFDSNFSSWWVIVIGVSERFWNAIMRKED